MSRLRKEINHQRHMAYRDAVAKWKKNNYCEDEDEVPTKSYDEDTNNLPYPTKVIPYTNTLTNNHIAQPTQTQYGGPIIKSSTGTNSGADDDTYRMMCKHCLWIRVFDKDDNILFNHANGQCIHTSQMIKMCTKLVKHMNLIAQTNEIEVQKALGTFKGTIIGQLTLPFDVNAQYSSWNDQDPSKNNVQYAIGAIAIIRQGKNNIFKGQLIDSYVGATFQI